MKKIVVLTRFTVFNEEFQMYDGIEEMINTLHIEGHKIWFISHDSLAIQTAKEIFKDLFDFGIPCGYRWEFKEVIDSSNIKKVILVGSSDEDLILAANKKLLIINPGWSVKQEDKPARYGITLSSPIKLLEAVRLIANQNSWYFKLQVDESTKVIALTSANTYNRDVTTEEREIVEGFSQLLKEGNRWYFESLYFHLISGIMKDDDLRGVDIWGVFPTSTGTFNNEIEELKERCRYLTGKRYNEPIFIRHTGVQKSHETNHAERLGMGCTKHLESIIINPYYKKKLKNKKICIIDDYLTNGISFETARNLLINAGAKEVILLALGRFKRGATGIYQKETYELTGDLYNPGYNYEKIQSENLFGEYNFEARNEIRNIHDIIYNS